MKDDVFDVLSFAQLGFILNLNHTRQICFLFAN